MLSSAAEFISLRQAFVFRRRVILVPYEQ